VRAAHVSKARLTRAQARAAAAAEATQLYRVTPAPGITAIDNYAVAAFDHFGVASISQSASHIRFANDGAFLPPVATYTTADGSNAMAYVGSFLLEADGAYVVNLMFSYIHNVTGLTTYSSQLLKITPAA
jgi:hypothetical protein